MSTADLFRILDLKTSSPMTLTQLASERALTLVGGPNLAQVFQVFDRFGNPIFNIGTAGGAGVTGDRLSAFRPSDIFNADWQTLTAVADNVVTNAGAFRIGHGNSGGRIFAFGDGAPSSSNPISTGMPPNGSFYFRTDGGTGTSIYMARSGSWVAIV